MLRQLQPFRLLVAADVLGVNLIRSLDPSYADACRGVRAEQKCLS
jgi:hypothetical protein